MKRDFVVAQIAVLLQDRTPQNLLGCHPCSAVIGLLNSYKVMINAIKHMGVPPQPAVRHTTDDRNGIHQTDESDHSELK